MSNIVGGFTPFRTEIKEKEMEIFKKATEILLGVNYEALAVSIQIVAGTNFRFFCNSKVVSPVDFNEAVIVEIYEDLQGNSSIRKIKEVC